MPKIIHCVWRMCGPNPQFSKWSVRTTQQNTKSQFCKTKFSSWPQLAFPTFVLPKIQSQKFNLFLSLFNEMNLTFVFAIVGHSASSRWEIEQLVNAKASSDVLVFLQLQSSLLPILDCYVKFWAYCNNLYPELKEVFAFLRSQRREGARSK